MSNLASVIKIYLKAVMNSYKRLSPENINSILATANSKTFLDCYPVGNKLAFKTSSGICLETVSFDNSFEDLNFFLKEKYGAAVCVDTEFNPFSGLFRLKFIDKTDDFKFQFDLYKTFKFSLHTKYSFPSPDAIIYEFCYKGIF